MGEGTPKLHMRRLLKNLPEGEVPAGYLLRTLRAEDLSEWASLLDQFVEPGEWSVDRARPYFREGSTMPLAGAFFVTTGGGVPVATAQLHLHCGGPYAPVPELGYVGTDAAHRGRGLGRLACLAVLGHAASEGHREIFLRTDEHRVAAIRTYLGLGFRPWPREETAAEDLWRDVLARVGVVAGNRQKGRHDEPRN